MYNLAVKRDALKRAPYLYVMHKELERHAAGRKRFSPPHQKYLGQGAARVPREVRNLTDGRQEGEAVTGRKPGKHLVPINQRPSNGGCWRVNSRPITEKSHVRVEAVGENHREATHQARQSFGGSVAHGVAIHLSVAGRGEIHGSTIVTINIMHNPAFESDSPTFDSLPLICFSMFITPF